MKKLVFMLLLMASTGLYAVSPVAGVDTCTSVRSSIQRLACFDELFSTPVYIDALNIPQNLQPGYGIVGIINQQESQRPTDSYDLIMNTSIEHAEADQRRVVLSAPAIGAIGVRPLFALSCIDNITRLQIILPEPLDVTRTVLSVYDQDGQRLLSEQWKIIGGGYIIDAGRGIPSIEFAQRLTRSKRITLGSDQAALEGMVFDLEKLPQQITELATACHWMGYQSGAEYD